MMSRGLSAAEAPSVVHFFSIHSVMSLEGRKNAGKNVERVNWSHLLCLQTQIFCVSVCHHNRANEALGDLHWCFCGVSCPANKRVVLNLSNHPEGSDLDCSSSLASWEDSNTSHRHRVFQLVEFNDRPCDDPLESPTLTLFIYVVHL